MDDKTYNELLIRMIRCSTMEDIEEAHIEADKVLCSCLVELGFGEIVNKWRKVSKVYA